MATDMTPSEKNNSEQQTDKIIESHDYDGIKELNNAPPLWISFIFIITIGFSFFYAIHFFGYPNNKKDQVSQYEQKVAAFDLKKEEIRMNAQGSGTPLNNEQRLAEGAKLYSDKGCIACHGLAGEGNNIGPNLSDTFWINGCTESDVFKIITEGKPEKGMTPYKNMMTADQIQSLAKHILITFSGSNPANPKAPQGEECIQ